MGRDAISTYINGRNLPNPKSLNLLSQALGVGIDELLPGSSKSDEFEAIELRPALGHPGKAWVRIERILSFETAAKIVSLINDEDSQRTAK